jgi:hypothetical protein
MRNGRVRERHVSKGRLNLRPHFLRPGRPKMRIRRRRESEVEWVSSVLKKLFSSLTFVRK